MTDIVLLDALKSFIEENTKDIILSTSPDKDKKGKGKPGKRAAEVHKMRLPGRDVADATEKRVPYIVIQFLNGQHEHNPGESDSTCKVRIIVVTYSEDGQAEVDCLNIITRIRVALLKAGEIGQQFLLRSPLEYVVYPDNLFPYATGEIMTIWEMPVISREVQALHFDEATTDTPMM